MNTEPKSVSSGLFGKRPRWFFAELIIIIAGILIALAIDEWRGDIEDARVEQEYLHRLIGDLQSTEQKMRAVEEYNSVSENAVAELLSAFESNDNVDIALLGNLLYAVFDFDNPTPVLGTAEALVATGDLRFIGTADVKSIITQYVSDSRDFWLVPLYQLENDYRTEFFRLLAIAERYGISRKSNAGISRRTSEADIDAFLADPDAYAAVIRLKSIKKAFSVYRESTAADATKLRASLEPLLLSE